MTSGWATIASARCQSSGIGSSTADAGASDVTARPRQHIASRSKSDMHARRNRFGALSFASELAAIHARAQHRRLPMANVDDLLSQLPMSQIAAMLGVDEDTAANASRAAVPALVHGMKANAQDQ